MSLYVQCAVPRQESALSYQMLDETRKIDFYEVNNRGRECRLLLEKRGAKGSMLWESNCHSFWLETWFQHKYTIWCFEIQYEPYFSNTEINGGSIHIHLSLNIMYSTSKDVSKFKSGILTYFNITWILHRCYKVISRHVIMVWWPFLRGSQTNKPRKLDTSRSIQ